jgi:hypothetical protein
LVSRLACESSVEWGAGRGAEALSSCAAAVEVSGALSLCNAEPSASSRGRDHCHGMESCGFAKGSSDFGFWDVRGTSNSCFGVASMPGTSVSSDDAGAPDAAGWMSVGGFSTSSSGLCHGTSLRFPWALSRAVPLEPGSSGFSDSKAGLWEGADDAAAREFILRRRARTMQKIRIPMRRTAIGTAIPMPIFAPVDKLVADSRDILVPELVGVLVAMVGLLVDS